MQTEQSALTVILKLVMQWSDDHQIVLSTVSLQFQGWVVPVSLRPVLRTLAVYIMATVWFSYS